MKVEKEKSALYIKGPAEIYHSVTYMYGWLRFFGFSVDGSYYALEEKQDNSGNITAKLTEVSEAEFEALLGRFRQMTKRWKGKSLKTLREDDREQQVEFSHPCKKQLILHRKDVSIYTQNRLKDLIDEI